MTGEVAETPARRKKRLIAQKSLWDTRRIAGELQISVERVQELDRLRRAAQNTVLIADPESREWAEARAYLRIALPAPVAGARVWRCGAIWRWAYDTQRVDYETGRVRRAPSPGRTPGGPPVRPRHRPGLAEQARKLRHVRVPDGLGERMRLPLLAAYEASRAGGKRGPAARREAADLIARASGTRPEVAHRVLLEALVDP